jgi:hypothetical protein
MLETSNSPAPLMPSNYKFGWFFAIAFGVLAAIAFWKHEFDRAEIFASLALLFSLTALVAPRLLTPLNRLWFQLGMLLSKVISPLVLGLIFLVLITPVALVTRLFGRDALRINKRSVPSYWVGRVPVGPEPSSFKHQF